ncbi:MAG: cytochrome d ubiquinol oxidase subunit II [Prevotellaceae bacterium]|nr:cytochrome d ubiquinol oxidase subunit II [Prevotellaceae bacterium]
MSYVFLQHYWWFLVSLLGALLVFMMFVQGANSAIACLSRSETERRMIVASTGRKWELTFTTLVTFGGAFFASFPLFYSTSFGGAYWLWMIILFTFVLQAVSYEFHTKLGNLLGARTFRCFLMINGVVGPVLIGGAVATFFDGSNFLVDKMGITSAFSPIISRWANGSHGLDALLDPWNVVLGLAVFFLVRSLGILFIANNVEDENIRSRVKKHLLWSSIPFVLLFVAFLVHLFVKDGFGYDPSTGEIVLVPHKYLLNLIEMWYVGLLLLLGVILYIYGIVHTLVGKSKTGGIWFSGVGTVLAVLALLLCAGWNNTAYYPSLVDPQSSLTISNSCSSYFTLSVMSVVSILIPFVLAYIICAWRAIDKKKVSELTVSEAEGH